MEYQKCKDDYIKTSNKIRRKTISLPNKLFNNNENIEFIKQHHMNELQTLDNIFFILEDKINYIQTLLKNKNIESSNDDLKKTDIDKLFPIFFYYINHLQNNNNNNNIQFDTETGVEELD